jgi:hypothetical protein
MEEIWIVTYSETIDDDRVAGVALKARGEEDALISAAAYFSDWNFTAPEVVATRLPLLFTEPIYIAVGTH